VIVSLGSGSATANLLGGLVLTYTRAFHVGDRVKIGEVEGEITSLGAFSTRLRTPQNEEVVIPNSLVQSGTVKNYTTHAKQEGVAVSVKVSVGYETPWRKVHELLLLAAKHTMGIKSDPEAFVLQRALGDSVDYELRAHTDRSHELDFVIARLHQAVQDAFFREGVEIATTKKSPRVPEGRKNKPMEFQLAPSQDARIQPVDKVRDAEPSFVVIADAPPKKSPPPPAVKTEAPTDPEPDAEPAKIEPMPIVASRKKDETIVGLGAPKVGKEKGEPGGEKP
jgi:hypothetical protein